MVHPLAICVEDLDAVDEDSRYLRCVVLPGPDPGLGVTGEGHVVWEQPMPNGCELSVSADERLLLWRPEGAQPVRVRRAGRSLDVPFEKPVILIDQDQVDLGGRRYRLHVHGVAHAVHPPAPLRSRAMGAAAATLAAAVALGGAATGCDDNAETGDIEVRAAPPSIAEPAPEDAGSDGAVHPDASADASASATATTKPHASASVSAKRPGQPPPIEVRPTPPRMAPPEGWKPTKK